MTTITDNNHDLPTCTVPERSNLHVTENAVLNVFLKRSALRSPSVPV